MKISRPSPSMVVAGIALFVSMGGTSVAAVTYAARAGSVDGKSAVYSGATLSQAAGKLVATNRSGADKGRLPNKFVADVPHTATFGVSTQVNDNAPGAPITLVTIEGLGTLSTNCNDQGNAAGAEDPISIIAFNNLSGVTVNTARRAGVADAVVAGIPTGTTAPLTIGGSNTFFYHVQLSGRNVYIDGTVRQDGRGGPTAACLIYGSVVEVGP